MEIRTISVHSIWEFPPPPTDNVSKEGVLVLAHTAE